MARRAITVVVAVLAAMLPVAVPAGAEEHGTITVAPTCVAAGVPTRIVILGRSWEAGPVALSATTGAVTTQLGSATPRTSPVGQQPGSFSFGATVTATPPTLEVTALQGTNKRTVTVFVQSVCPWQLTAKPACLSVPGQVTVSGTGFTFGTSVVMAVDPFGNAEAPPQNVPTTNGSFTANVTLPALTGPIPIVVSQQGTAGISVSQSIRGVVFVDPCPPPATTTTVRQTTTTRGVTTTAAVPGTTTTLVLGIPPEVPGETPPGTPVKVSISPRTVRPGRCVVLVLSDAPPAAPVTARFADGPPVPGTIGPDGRAVVSVCVPHDSGGRLGPVAMVLAIAAFPPVTLSSVLRVPPRPQPPLLQAGSDSRRS